MDLDGMRSSRFIQKVARSQIDLRSSCRLCSDFAEFFTLKRNAPSLQAPRAETRLTVDRALRSGGKSGAIRKLVIRAAAAPRRAPDGALLGGVRKAIRWDSQAPFGNS